MKKLSIIAAASALALSTAAPVVAQEQKVESDPFVSTQGAAGSLGLGLSAGAVAGIVGGIVLVTAIAAASDDSSSGTTTTE